MISMLLGLGFALNAATVSVPNYVSPARECPKATFTDRYIEVPLIHDLKSMARVENIPNLKLHEKLLSDTEGMKLNVYYELLSAYDPAKEILVLIPGGPGGNHEDIHGLPQAFEKYGDVFKNYNVIAMDHRGVGCSRPIFPGYEPPEALKMRFAAADLELIRRELGGANGKINLIGTSYGTMLAQTYALLFPDHLNKVVLFAAFSSADQFTEADEKFEQLVYYGVGDEAAEKLRLIKQSHPEFFERLMNYGVGQMYDYYGRTDKFPKKIIHVKALLDLKDENMARAVLPPEPWTMPYMMRSIVCQEIFKVPPEDGAFHVFAQQFGSCSEFEGLFDYFDYTEALRNVNARTFVIGGAWDHVTPGFAMERMAKRLPDSYLYLDAHVGHFPHAKIECFGRLLNKFFDGADNAAMDQVATSDACVQAPPPPPLVHGRRG